MNFDYFEIQKWTLQTVRLGKGVSFLSYGQ